MAVSAIRTFIIYVFIIIAMRIMGKRQLGEMQPAELVVTLMISDLAAVPMQDSGTPIVSGLVPIMVLIALELILSGIMLKVPFFHRLISGRPKIVIDKGKIDAKALKDMRLSIEDLMESLRQQGAFDLREIEYAIVESNGKISVYLKPGSRPATCNDMSLEVPDNGLPMVVISDGTVSQWGLQVCGLDGNWLTATLKKNKCHADEVFIMTADRSRAYTIMKKERTAG